jgi:hypothetical protein
MQQKSAMAQNPRNIGEKKFIRSLWMSPTKTIGSGPSTRDNRRAALVRWPGFSFNMRILFQFPAILYMQLWGALCK